MVPAPPWMQKIGGCVAGGLDRHQRAPTGVIGFVLEQLGERLDRRRAEDRPERQRGTEFVLDRAEQVRRRQRRHSQVEEIIGDADRADLQLPLPDLRELALDLGARLHQVAVLRAAATRFRQRLAVDLAVRRQRERLEERHGRGHHVRREARAGVVAQLLRAGRRLGDDHVRRELGLGIRTTRRDDRLGHARMPGEDRLDLTQLDPEPADLHLVVDSAEELDLPVWPGIGRGRRSDRSWPPASGRRDPR